MIKRITSYILVAGTRYMDIRPRRLLHYLMFLLAYSLLIQSTEIRASSFDCSKAGDEVEMKICGDKTLSLLDDELSEAYRIARESSNYSKNLKTEQLKWLKRRGGCDNERCLIDMYQKRIDELHRSSLARGEGKYFVLAKSKLLESGFGNERDDICEKLAENLNKVRSAPPMICELTFPENATGFEVPVWKRVRVDDKATLSEVEDLIRENPRGLSDDWVGKLDSRVESGKFSLYSSKFDFNADGNSDEVYQIREYWNKSRCEYSGKRPRYENGSPSYRYAVRDLSSEDGDNKIFEVVNGERLHGVFLYKGAPYFYHWSYGGNEYGMIEKKYVRYPFPRIMVYRGNSLSLGDPWGKVQVCEIGYSREGE